VDCDGKEDTDDVDGHAAPSGAPYSKFGSVSLPANFLSDEILPRPQVASVL